MIQEQKDLLLKDLSARLPYGVKFLRESWDYEWDQELSVIEVLEDIDKNGYINNRKVYNVEDIKPYLFPLSSMTEEQINEFILISDTVLWLGNKRSTCILSLEQMDWCNKNHFDYRGLIPMGLAIDATGKNIYCKTKEELIQLVMEEKS